MVYKPIIKNLPKLIDDLQEVHDGKLPPTDLKRKMDYYEYEFDSTDGFEDILDAISPFIKRLTKIASLQEDQQSKEKITELIKRLKDERSLKDLEEIR